MRSVYGDPLKIFVCECTPRCMYILLAVTFCNNGGVARPQGRRAVPQGAPRVQGAIWLFCATCFGQGCCKTMFVLRGLVRMCPKTTVAWENGITPFRHRAACRFVRHKATKPIQESSSAVDTLLQGARLTQGAHYAWSMLVQPGDVVGAWCVHNNMQAHTTNTVDATCGNGHDTLELARMVGPSGRVVSFDIQADALASAQTLLDSSQQNEELCRDVRFVQACHSTMQVRLHACCFPLVTWSSPGGRGQQRGSGGCLQPGLPPWW